MKIKNAKELLVAIKDQISKNLTDKEREDFLNQFNSLIQNCPNYSKAYSVFCVELLTRCKGFVKLEYKDVIKSIDNIILLFNKKDSTKKEFKDAYAAAYAADAVDIVVYAAHAAAYAADAAAYSDAADAADAAYAAADAAYAADAAAADADADAARKEEYNKQSIDLINSLKKRGGGRPRGSINRIKSEPKKALPKVPLSKWDRCLEAILKIVGVKNDSK